MDHALTRRIGMRLRSARQARGLSMKQVSQLTGGRLGVSRIANFENGTRRPSIESAVMLAAALGNIPVPELLCLGGESAALRSDEARLLHRFRAVDPGKRRDILIAAAAVAAATSTT